jgi:hypothetical protein
VSRTRSTDELSGLSGVSFQWARFPRDHPLPDGDAVEGYGGKANLAQIQPEGAGRDGGSSLTFLSPTPGKGGTD